MKLTDGRRTIEISMYTINGADRGEDWSHDFFEAGALRKLPGSDIAVVTDVEYCIDQANDWANMTGDFAADKDTALCGDRVVTVEEIDY